MKKNAPAKEEFSRSKGGVVVSLNKEQFYYSTILVINKITDYNNRININVMPKIKIGLSQMSSDKKPEKNLEKARINIQELAKKGAQIICLPELFLTTYFCQTKNKTFFDLAETVPGPATKALGEIAKKNKVIIITSVYEKTLRAKPDIKKPKGFFNTGIIINQDGKLLGKYRKMHIPDDLKNYYGEAHYFEPGVGFKVFQTPLAKISVMVCWDQWFPEGARVCAAKGAQIIFYPTAIGYQLQDKFGQNSAEHEAWQTIQRSHAIANNVFVVAVNRVGQEDNLCFWGTSFVSDPYGRIIAKASKDKEENVIVECDLSLISQMRTDWPFLKARRIKI